MPQDIRVWEVEGESNTLKEIKSTKLEKEELLEMWLEQDISILSEDLLVIGRQVQTDFGGVIDLLCLDSNGDVVIVEIKRDRTPREITAQVLDYASWVEDLSSERLTGIADDYLGDRGPLDQAFQKRFDMELPEVLNNSHRMLIVASEVDPSSERIIKYLSNTYGVNINAATFQHFVTESGRKLLARVFLVEPEEVEYQSGRQRGRKRTPNLTYDQLEEQADSNGVRDLYHQAFDGFSRFFDYRQTTLSGVAFVGNMQGARHVILSLFPRDSDPNDGLRFSAYLERLAQYVGAQEGDVLSVLPNALKRGLGYKGGPEQVKGYFKDESQIRSALEGLKRLRTEHSP